jgi:hypothetical protein
MSARNTRQSAGCLPPCCFKITLLICLVGILAGVAMAYIAAINVKSTFGEKHYQFEELPGRVRGSYSIRAHVCV